MDLEAIRVNSINKEYRKKKHSKKTHKSCINYYGRGFSLLELSVVLGIVGVLAVGSIGVYSEQRTHVLWQESQARLALVKASLLNFTKTNKYMPCPDATGNGLEDRVGVACQVNNGGLPFVALGLSQAEAADSWGNPFTYAVNQSTTNALAIEDCPENSACFFNNNGAPRFDLSTLPMMNVSADNNMRGTLSAVPFSNLRVCNTAACNAASGGAVINGDALIAVVVSHNENGTQQNGLDVAEALNQDGTNYFSQQPYSEDPYFDDVLITISANELKDRYETEVVELTNGGGGGPPVNPFANTTVGIAGGNGDDDRFASEIGVNISTGTINFGSALANQMVTLTFDAKITGGWEDADALNEGIDAEVDRRGRLETQDKFVVGLNADVDQELYDIADARDPDDGRVDVDRIAELMGNPSDDQYFYYDENDDRDNTWYEYASYNVKLDENGDLKIDFAVFSTAVEEQVEVSNIEAVRYTAPTSVPTVPEVGFINGKKFNEIVEDGSLELSRE